MRRPLRSLLRCRRRAGVAAGTAALLCLAVGAAQATPCTGQPSNLPIDTDLDGASDLVCVSDFDGDGQLEMDDIQDALESLSASGAKTVYVLPGDYAPPADPSARPGRQNGLLELPSDTTLWCDVTAGTVKLNGPAGTTASDDYAVVTNADHAHGNQNLRVRQCEIDGGAPDVFDGRRIARRKRMGVYFRRTQLAIVEGSFVHHTYHTGLYTSNSNQDRFLGNLVQDAGGRGDIAPSGSRFGYPCIYAFAFGGGTVDFFVAGSNQLDRCAGSGIATRSDDSNGPGDAVRDAFFQSNWVSETGWTADLAPGDPARGTTCVTVRGVERLTIRDLTCTSSGGLFLDTQARDYRSAGDDNANRDVTIENVTLADVDAVAGLWVGSHVDGLTVRDLRIEGTRRDDGSPAALDCLRFDPPLRNAVFEDLTLRDCGRHGVREGGSLDPGADPVEALTFRRVHVENVDVAAPYDTQRLPGFLFTGRHRGLRLESVTSEHATGVGLQFDARVEDAWLEDVVVDAEAPAFVGGFARASLPRCDATREGGWVRLLDAQSTTDCSAQAASGATAAHCRCASGSWIPFGAPPPHAGISFADLGGAAQALTLEDVQVRNAGGAPGVRVEGYASGVTILHLTGEDASVGSNPDQRSALQIAPGVATTLADVACVGTDPSVPCVEYVYESSDYDADGVANADDNCLYVPNTSQANADDDPFGNACDDDDDGDGLLDSVETNTGVFVDLSDTGTDPLRADTDGDGADDLREATSGKDPSDPASTPLLPAVPGLTPLGGVGLILTIGVGFARARASRSCRRTRATLPAR